MNLNLAIRRATGEDADQLWEIIRQVIARGDTYVFSPDSSREKMLSYWLHPDAHTYVATMDEAIVGTFIIKDNFPDLGSHVANAGYMTSPQVTGQGIGTAMGKYSLEEARRLGYRAMQFNIVVSTNVQAVRLWKKLGFEIRGEIPAAFQHAKEGFVSSYIMWRSLREG
ncbi:MAG: GNAT family N-acetyltransferase [Saprospiraceae bacterium]|nr:GNAT family N-acetyltransferase [Saprospiraceae bacterium]